MVRTTSCLRSENGMKGIIADIQCRDMASIPITIPIQWERTCLPRTCCSVPCRDPCICRRPTSTAPVHPERGRCGLLELAIAKRPVTEIRRLPTSVSRPGCRPNMGLLTRKPAPTPPGQSGQRAKGSISIRRPGHPKDSPEADPDRAAPDPDRAGAVAYPVDSEAELLAAGSARYAKRNSGKRWTPTAKA